MPTLQVLTTKDAIAERLWSLRPRDSDFRRVDVAEPALALPVVQSLPAWRRLLAAAVAEPTLWEVVLHVWQDDAQARALACFVREPFPPSLPIPELPTSWLDDIQELALGMPGEPVAHGLFPSRLTKLARLLLARAGIYPAEPVLAAARHAYDAGRSHPRGTYHAHDAVACAVVHPDIDALALLEAYARHTRAMRGWRSRRKTHRLLAWVRRGGHL